MRVDDLDDGHRAQQEEDDLRRAEQGLAEIGGDDLRVANRCGIERPEQARADQRRCRLVDAEGMLEHDRGIGRHENHDQQSGDHVELP